jgi:hypothetical protein
MGSYASSAPNVTQFQNHWLTCALYPRPQDGAERSEIRAAQSQKYLVTVLRHAYSSRLVSQILGLLKERERRNLEITCQNRGGRRLRGV